MAINDRTIGIDGRLTEAAWGDFIPLVDAIEVRGGYTAVNTAQRLAISGEQEEPFCREDYPIARTGLLVYDTDDSKFYQLFNDSTVTAGWRWEELLDNASLGYNGSALQLNGFNSAADGQVPFKNESSGKLEWKTIGGGEGTVQDVKIGEESIVTDNVATITLNNSLIYNNSGDKKLSVNVSNLQTESYTPTGSISLTTTSSATASHINVAGTIPTFNRQVSSVATEGINISLDANGSLTFSTVSQVDVINNASEFTAGEMPTFDDISIINVTGATFAGTETKINISTKQGE